MFQFRREVDGYEGAVEAHRVGVDGTPAHDLVDRGGGGDPQPVADGLARNGPADADEFRGGGEAHLLQLFPDTFVGRGERRDLLVGDEGALPGDALEETVTDQSVQHPPHGHPGNPEGGVEGGLRGDPLPGFPGPGGDLVSDEILYLHVERDGGIAVQRLGVHE